MSPPRHIFLDTSIIDATGYNFQGNTVRAFVIALQTAESVVLLPKCTESEILRHISERADEAHKALVGAARRAPFLQKWDKWPGVDKESMLAYQLGTLGRRDFEEFLTEINVIRLDYSQVSIELIMQWYEHKIPPFGDGKKRKEFPDAIAFAALLAYAEKHDEQVAIVSADGDFAKACEGEHNLHFYSTLSAITQALIEGDTRVAAIRSSLDKDFSEVVRGVEERFPELDFYPEADETGEACDVEVTDVHVRTFDVIGIGESTATIAFSADVKYQAHVSYPDPDYWIRDDDDGNLVSLRSISGTVSDTTEVAGTAKLEFTANWSRTAKIADVSFEQSSIEVPGEPEQDDDDYYSE